MTRTPHQIPIAFAPIPGEGLDSWLESYARRLRISGGELLAYLGLGHSRLTRMVNRLAPNERDALAAATYLSPDRLDAMTLHRFDRVAVTIDPGTRVLGHPPAWRRQAGSRYCPHCLRQTEGRWQLTWRLPWTFACIEHNVLLLDTCPTCGRRPLPHRPQGREATRPAACPENADDGSGRPPACAAALDRATAQPLPTGSRVAHAQDYINQVILRASSPDDAPDRLAARQQMREFHVLSYKALRALERAAERAPDAVQPILADCGGRPPAKRQLDSYDAATVATATTLAVTAHDNNDPASADVLRWIVHTGLLVSTTKEPGRLMQPWADATEQLTRRVLTALDDVLDTRHRLAFATTTPTPRVPAWHRTDQRRRAASLPALLWPDWSMRLIPPSFGDLNAPDKPRAALAAMTLIPGSHISYRQAAALLGHLGRTRLTTTSLIANADNDTLSSTIRGLNYLAQLLDEQPAPIDYQRRRAIAGAPTTVDRNAYAEMSATHGWNRPSPLQLNILDAHLRRLLSGCPATTPKARKPAAWNPLRWALPQPAREFVQQQGHAILHRHNIDEPLTWQPPLPADADIHWPGIESAEVDQHRYIAALTEFLNHNRSLARITEATGLSSAHARIYAEIAEPELSEQDWNDLANPKIDQELFDAGRLRQLYENDERPLSDIARLSLTSETAVRRALEASGVPIATRRPRRLALSRDWFQTHYLDTAKTLKQVAHETRHADSTLRRLALEHGIPVHKRGRRIQILQNLPADARPSQAVRKALEFPGIALRRVLAMQSHPSQQAAAAAFGLTDTAVSRAKLRVESAIGFPIFEARPPLRPTRRGRTFLREAAQALAYLDRAEPSEGS